MKGLLWSSLKLPPTIPPRSSPSCPHPLPLPPVFFSLAFLYLFLVTRFVPACHHTVLVHLPSSPFGLPVSCDKMDLLLCKALNRIRGVELHRAGIPSSTLYSHWGSADIINYFTCFFLSHFSLSVCQMAHLQGYKPKSEKPVDVAVISQAKYVKLSELGLDNWTFQLSKPLELLWRRQTFKSSLCRYYQRLNERLCAPRPCCYSWMVNRSDRHCHLPVANISALTDWPPVWFVVVPMPQHGPRSGRSPELTGSKLSII